MLTFIRNRTLLAVPVVVGISALVFLILQLLPGDPVIIMLGESRLPTEQVERIREELGLKDPLPIQYGRFAWKALQGDLGRSMRTNQPVTVIILNRLPSTLELAFVAILLATVFGVTMGVLAATHQNTWIDTFCSVIALFGVTMPVFWLGLMLLFIFALWLGWFPITGQGGPARLVLPAVTLAWFSAGTFTRLTRSSMLEVMGSDYVVTARAKGLKERVVIYRHALRNALIPVITIIGIQFGDLLAGAVVTETVFARSGLGRLIVESILQKDLPVVQGAVLVTALMYVIVNLLVDISYAVIDPRIRYG
jgi:peptide/nickel transport system permease protein